MSNGRCTGATGERAHHIGNGVRNCLRCRRATAIRGYILRNPSSTDCPRCAPATIHAAQNQQGANRAGHTNSNASALIESYRNLIHSGQPSSRLVPSHAKITLRRKQSYACALAADCVLYLARPILECVLADTHELDGSLVIKVAQEIDYEEFSPPLPVTSAQHSRARCLEICNVFRCTHIFWPPDVAVRRPRQIDGRHLAADSPP
jgi:hypothetical protein